MAGASLYHITACTPPTCSPLPGTSVNFARRVCNVFMERFSASRFDEAPRQVQLPVWPEHLLRKTPGCTLARKRTKCAKDAQSREFVTPKRSGQRITISRYAAGSTAWCDLYSSPSNVMVMSHSRAEAKRCLHCQRPKNSKNLKEASLPAAAARDRQSHHNQHSRSRQQHFAQLSASFGSACT